MKKKRKIIAAAIEFLSLCKRGKNRQPIIFKSDDQFELTKTIAKFDTESNMLTALVYVPEYVDADGEFASAEVVKAMGYDWLARGAKIDVRHDCKPLTREQAKPCESFIVQKGDPRFADWKDEVGAAVDPTGAWAVVVEILDPALRKSYGEGGWNGVSMFGRGEFETIKEDEEEPHMPLDEKDLEAIGKMIAKAVEPLTPKPDDEVKKGPLDGVDLTNQAAVDLALKRAQIQSLVKSADLTTPEGIATFRSLLVDVRKAEEEAETPEQTIARLRKENASLKRSAGASNQGNADTSAGKKTEDDLKKADEDKTVEGLLAAAANLGYAKPREKTKVTAS